MRDWLLRLISCALRTWIPASTPLAAWPQLCCCCRHPRTTWKRCLWKRVPSSMAAVVCDRGVTSSPTAMVCGRGAIPSSTVCPCATCEHHGTNASCCGGASGSSAVPAPSPAASLDHPSPTIRVALWGAPKAQQAVSSS
ncbi:hypothetical protein BKA80DRAFT_281823 [Phyllosticta citrichinensis]